MPDDDDDDDKADVVYSSVQLSGSVIGKKEKPKETKEAPPPLTESQLKDQLLEFLAYSERARARFIRYHAGVIPQKCREWV